MPVIILNVNGNLKSVLYSFVPKTGGTSLISFFKNINAKVYLHNENNDIVGLLRCPSQHFHYEIQDIIYDFDKFDFSFSVVRNPFSRLRSDYFWSFRLVEDQSKWPDFEAWFSSVQSKYEKNSYYWDNHIRPQSDFIGPKIKKIYKYENGLEAVVKDILKSLSIELKVNTEHEKFVPVKNRAKKEKINKNNFSISESTKLKIRKIYRKDFEIWESLR